LLTFPSHTTHALQPLDVSCFKPFKTAFRAYRDRWTLSHVASWVSWALKKALTKENITSGFRATGIFPLNRHVVDKKFGPSLNFEAAAGPVDEEPNAAPFSKTAFLQELNLDDCNEETMSKLPQCNQYFVNVEGEEGIETDNSSSDNENENGKGKEKMTDNFTELPKVPLPKVRRTTKAGEPYIDYSKSIWMTQGDYLKSLEQIAMKKELAAQGREEKRLEGEA